MPAASLAQVSVAKVAVAWSCVTGGAFGATVAGAAGEEVGAAEPVGVAAAEGEADPVGVAVGVAPLVGVGVGVPAVGVAAAT